MAIEEIAQTIDRLGGAFDDMCMRGLRAAGPRDVAVLRAMREEFDRIGAAHLAARIAMLIEAIEKDDRGAAGALLRAQASLRVFERLLTLRSAAAAVAALASTEAETEDEE